MQFSIDRIATPDAELSENVARFLDAAWNEFHADRGDDLTIEWASTPILISSSAGDGALIGVARGSVSAGIGHLSELMVARDYRGTGVGSALLTDFEEYCVAVGCHKLTVHTVENEGAHRFYVERDWRLESRFIDDRGHQTFVRLVKFVHSE